MRNKIALLLIAFAVAFPLSVNAGGGPIYINTSELPAAVKGTYFAGAILYNNENSTPVKVSISNLPPGISINGAGNSTASFSGGQITNSFALSGTPTKIGNYEMLVTITEQNGTAAGQAYVRMSVNASKYPTGVITITGQDLPQTSVGQYYQGTIRFVYGSAYHGQTKVENLPPGLSYGGPALLSAVTGQPDSTDTAELYILGTPVETGNYTFTVTLGYGTATTLTKNFNVTVTSANGTPGLCQILSFNASPTAVQAGKSTSLSWDTINCKTVTLTQITSGGQVIRTLANTYFGSGVSSNALTAPAAIFRLTASFESSVEQSTGSVQQDITVNVTDNATAHGEGTNILGSDGTVYRIVGSARSPYTSAGAFLSYKFNTWATVVQANSADMALPLGTYVPNDTSTSVTSFIPPRSGALINDHGTIYLMTGGGRAGFATEAVFKGLGFSFSNVYPGDTSFIGLNYEPINSINLKHHDGVLINDNGTLYVMKNGYRVGFPSMAVLDSWGYWVNEAVPANSYDRQAEVSGVMQARMVNQMSI